MADFTCLLIAALAVWRVTHLLAAEDGPWDMSVRLRRAAGKGFFGRLLDCFYCLSVWIALPAAWVLHKDLIDGALVWLGLSGAAILLERVTAPREAPVAPVHFIEDE